MNKFLLLFFLNSLTASFSSFSQGYINVESELDNSKIVVNFSDTFDMINNKTRLSIGKGLTIIENIKSGYIPKTKVVLYSRVGVTKYSFDSLTKIPVLTKAVKRISLNRVASDSVLKNLYIKVYEDYSDYKQNRISLQLDGVEDYLDLNWKRIEYELENFMNTESISHSSNKDGLSVAKNTARLNLEILEMELIRIPDVLAYFEIEVKFILLNLNYKEIGSEVLRIQSKYSTDDDYSKNIAYALEDGLSQFITNCQKTGLLQIDIDDSPKFSGLSDIQPPFKSLTNFVDARKTVVTVLTENGHGSGCKISKNGHVLTNFHVISESDSIRIITFEGDTLLGNVVMTDPILDITLISTNIESDDYFELKENNIPLGEKVYVIGTPIDLKLSHSISKGIVSAHLKLNEIDYIQTDAEINSGNSGGALVNSDGQLIGLVNAKAVGVLIEGIGFAITTKSIIEGINISYK